MKNKMLKDLSPPLTKDTILFFGLKQTSSQQPTKKQTVGKKQELDADVNLAVEDFVICGTLGRLKFAVQRAKAAGQYEACLARLGGGPAADHVLRLLSEEVQDLGLNGNDRVTQMHKYRPFHQDENLRCKPFVLIFSPDR